MRYHALAGALARRPLPSRLHRCWQRGVGKATGIVACCLCSEQAPRPNCSLKRTAAYRRLCYHASSRQRPLSSSVRLGWGQCFGRVALPVSSRSVLLPACAELAGSHFHASASAWPACALCASVFLGARGVNRAVLCVRGRARAQATTFSLAWALAAWRRQSHQHRGLPALLRASSAA